MRMLTEADRPMSYCLFDTAIGAVGIAWSGDGITRLQLPESGRSSTERRLRGHSMSTVETPPPPEIKRAIGDVQEYMVGKRTDFSRTKLDLTNVSAFHRRIYDALRRIGWGETTTYGTLAQQAGDPGASRAVGQAMGRNPVPIIIPCHRVLASGGKPGGFSAYGGAVTKLRLLALEGVRPGHDTPLLPGLLYSGKREG
jgi:methylated-DNA-[protein]-cysteine S-methyltransferase